MGSTSFKEFTLRKQCLLRLNNAQNRKSAKKHLLNSVASTNEFAFVIVLLDTERAMFNSKYTFLANMGAGTIPNLIPKIKNTKNVIIRGKN